MRTIPYTDARNNLETVLDCIVNGAKPIIITRQDSEDVVVMSLSHYSSLIETLYLLRSTANAKRLNRSIEQYRNNGTRVS